MKRILFAVVLAVLATAVPAKAQIGVIDISSIRQQIQQLILLRNQLQQMKAQYDHLKAEAQSLSNLPTRYRYQLQNWRQFAADSQYGNTGIWAAGANNGIENTVRNGYRALIPTVQAVAPNGRPQDVAVWKQQYGLLQLQDAAAINGVSTAGTVRTNIQQAASAIQQLEADATSADAALNSQKALLQKQLFATLILLRTLQDTNRLLTASIDLQVQAAAQQRWDRGEAMNTAATIRNSQ